jgi:integrase
LLANFGAQDVIIIPIMATLKLTLDTRRVKKDGTFPLVFKLTVNRSSTQIQTGISILESQFDSENNLVVNSSSLNEQLLKLDALYRTRLNQYILANQGHEKLEVAKKHVLNKRPDEVTILEFWNQTIEEMKNAGRLGGVKPYEQSLKAISKEINLNVPFRNLSYKDVITLENKLLNRGMSVNGMSVYFRTFRAICNKAINLDLIGYEWYPFRKFKIKKEKTTPRVLSLTELKAYFNLNISRENPRFLSWNIGKLIFMLRGINLRDLLMLTPKNIKGGRIIYKRSKTKKLYSIKITKEIQTTLDQFTPGETILGLITQEQLLSSKCIEHFQQKLKVTNKHLMNIGKELCMDEKISTYVFRYTYANIAKQLGYSKDLIAEALGHEYGNSVTGIYLEQFDLELIDTMNDNIIQTVLQT